MALLGLMFFCYALLRAWKLSFTHDEAYTFLRHVRNALADLITLKEVDPNHHPLNTLLMKLFFMLFGSHWLVLRMPTLLAYVLYLYFATHILRHSASLLIGVAGFILLNSNPFQLDFFSLARGYGGALACVMAALYYVQIYLRTGLSKEKYVWYAAIWAGLAPLFHISLLNFFLPFVAVLGLFVLIHTFYPPDNTLPRRNRLVNLWKSLAPLVVITLAVLAYLLPMAFRFKETGELDFAGNSGFLTDTVGTLIWSSLYIGEATAKILYSHYLLAFVCISVAAAVLIFLARLFRKQISWERSLPLFVLCLLTVAILAIILQHTPSGAGSLAR